MFDLGWTEMMLIGVVALIVVGPKELPTLFRAVGQAVGKARGMAREFSRAMEAAADEAGVKEINRQITAATRPVQFATDRIKQQAGLGKPPMKPGGTMPSAVIPAAGTPIPTTEMPDTPPTPLDPGEPLAGIKPGGATEALAARRAEERAALSAVTPPTDGTA